MADLRLKDIPTTATTPASDDYVELDGATNASRKILASALGGNFATNPPANGVAADDFAPLTGATNGARKLSPADQAAWARNGLDAGLACDGTAQANRLVAALPASASVGALATRGFFCKFRLPPAAPAAITCLWYVGTVATGVDGNSFACYLDTSGNLRFRMYNGSDYRETIATPATGSILSAYGAGRIICVQFGYDSSGASARDCRINGLDVTLSADTTQAGQPVDWCGVLYSNYFVAEGALQIEVYKFWATNFRPTLADAQDSFFLGGGVPWRHQWGQTNAYASDFSAGADGWTDYSYTTVTGNIDTGADGTGIPPSNDWLRVKMTSGNGLPIMAQKQSIAALAGRWNKTVRITASVFCASGSGVTYVTMANCGNFGLGTYNPVPSPLAVTPGSVVALDQTYVLSNTSTLNGLDRLWVASVLANGSTSKGLNNNDAIYLKDVRLHLLGAVCYFAPGESGDGCGYQLHDLSPNAADAVVPIAGWSWTRRARRGWLRTPPGGLSWTATFDPKSWLGQRALPAQAVVTLITTLSSASSTGQSTGVIGHANGLVAQFSAAASASAGLKRVCALATYLTPLQAEGNDQDYNVVTVPNGSAFTGTITGELHYAMTEGLAPGSSSPYP